MKKFICPYCGNDLLHHSEFCGEIGQANPVPETHPVADFLESVHVLVRVIALLLFVVLIVFVTSANAGGGYFEAPVVNGKCRPFMEPPKPWKRMYQKDELRIRLQAKQIQQFQVLYCVEYDEVERGKIIREYVIAEEWYVD